MLDLLLLEAPSDVPSGLDIQDTTSHGGPRWLRTADHAAGHSELNRLEKCRKQAVVWTHFACGAHIVTPLSCNSRFCAKCARKRADRVVDGYEAAIRTFERPALVTLTVPNCTAEELPATVSVLLESFRRLRRRKIWPAGRGLYSVEIRYTIDAGYHPHIHALADWQFVDLQELSRAWTQIADGLFSKVGLARHTVHQPDVQVVRNALKIHALREVVKYACGMKRNQERAEFQSWPAQVQLAIASAVAGTRLIAAWGGVHVAMKKRTARVCPCCGRPYHRDRDEEEWTRVVLDVQEFESRLQLWDRDKVFYSWQPRESQHDFRAPPAVEPASIP